MLHHIHKSLNKKTTEKLKLNKHHMQNSYEINLTYLLWSEKNFGFLAWTTITSKRSPQLGPIIYLIPISLKK